ncbi:Flagellar motor switch protein FliN (modular protein), partial [Pseudomonas sp. CES]
MMVGHRVEAHHRHDEVGRNQLSALVQQLVVGMLAVAADATPDNRTGVGLHRGAVLQHALAVGLHVQLLQVLGDVAQVMVVRQDRVTLGAPEVAVPHAQQGQQHRHVLVERRGLEVL